MKFRQWAPWISGVVAAVVLAALRLDLLRAGPDLDGDAYGHAIIGRTLLANPTDLRQHWVWLPLWHFCYAGLHLLGGGLEAMRKIDVGLSSLQPLLLVAALSPQKKGDLSAPISAKELRALAVRCLAPLLLILFPFAIEHGQTGEPEPLFAALLLGAVVLVDRRSRVGHLVAGLLLSLACVLRYEAWSTLPAFALAALAYRVVARRTIPPGSSARGMYTRFLAILLPGLTIVAWIFAHRAQYGEFFAFAKENAKFVESARKSGVGTLDPFYKGITWYAIRLPWHQLGPFVGFAFLGVVGYAAPLRLRAERREGLAFALVGTALLAFITWGWVRGQHLGLLRHFFAVLPFYAALLAHGVVAFVAFAARRLPLAVVIGGRPLRALTGALVGTAIVGALATYTVIEKVVPHQVNLRLIHRNAWREERIAADLLRREKPVRIFCDVAQTEVLSGLHGEEFSRAWVFDVDTAWVHEEAAKGKVLVVAPKDHFGKLTGVGEVLYEGERLRVVRFAATAPPTGL
jgi:hypothetical protein